MKYLLAIRGIGENLIYSFDDKKSRAEVIQFCKDKDIQYATSQINTTEEQK